MCILESFPTMFKCDVRSLLFLHCFRSPLSAHIEVSSSMVVLVINPIYNIRNLLINKITITKHTKGLKNNGVAYPLGGQVVKPLDLMKQVSGFRVVYLGRAPSNPKRKARVSQFTLILLGRLGSMQAKPLPPSLLHFPDINLMFFFVAIQLLT